MTPAEIDRVFGLGRQQMATGTHVEVFRERAQSGEERRYTKGFLMTASADFRPWTEREWRILERLGKHAGAPVAKPLDFLPADATGPARLQTRDAGATVEQWATGVPLRRGDVALRNVFEDCAYWWSLARHCLMALDALHALGFVHLDLKPDNVCLPWAPAGAGRPVQGQPLAPRFKSLTLIDVAFSLLPEVDFVEPLPLLRQPAYEYQSPRLLHALEEGRRGHLGPTRALDWRCDFYSLAAMLWRYLPELVGASAAGWTPERHVQASEFVRQLLDVHGATVSSHWPHRALIAIAALRLRNPDLTAMLQAGSTFDPDRELPLGAEPTPPTRISETPLRRASSRREPSAEGVASGPVPLAEARREPTASAPGALNSAPGALNSAPGALNEAPAEPAAGRRDAADTEPADTEPIDASAAAAPGDAPIRPRRRNPVVVPAAIVAVLIGAAVAWWVTSEQQPRFDAPESAPLAERATPLPAPARPPASDLATAPIAVTRPTASASLAAAELAAPAAAVERAASTAAVPKAGTTAEVDREASEVPSLAAAPAAPPVPALPRSDGLDAIAAELMRNRMTSVADAAERRLARVLKLAAESGEFRRRGAIRAAAQAVRSASPRPAFATPVRDQDARTFNDAALVAYGRSNDVADAVGLQTKAFGANPLDSEVVGNLAFLRLKERPPQADAARQLALHALTLNDARFPGGRVEDWTTLAIASALTGHDIDARNAWFVSMALTTDLQHQCDAAVRAQATYGERLRPSVQAMLQRARSSAAYGRCEVGNAAQASPTPSAGKPSAGKPNTGKSGAAKSGKRVRRAIP